MNPIKKYLRRFYVLNGKKNISVNAIMTLLTALLVCHINTAEAVNISDEPMETQVESAAANIMFILDNSGSMDWEFLTEGTDGKFEGNIEYLFDDPGDNNYGTGSSNGTILTGANRAKWKSQAQRCPTALERPMALARDRQISSFGRRRDSLCLQRNPGLVDNSLT